MAELFATVHKNHVSHFETEERHLSPLVAKLLSPRQLRKLGRRVYQQLTPAQWRVYLPFSINNMDIPMRRSMFLFSIVGSNPEHAQTIGRMIYEGVEEPVWDLCRVAVPDIVPRHVDGYSKMV